MSRQALGPIQPSFPLVPEFFAVGKAARTVKSTTHLRLLKRLRMSVAVPFTHLLPRCLDKKRGKFARCYTNSVPQTPQTFKHASYKIEWRHLLKLEKRAGSQMSYLNTIKTTYTFAYKSDVSWFRRVKDVAKYRVLVSVNVPVNLPPATVHGLLHIGVWHSAVQLTASEHSEVMTDGHHNFITNITNTSHLLPRYVVPCHHGTAGPQGCWWGNILNKSRTVDKGWPPRLGAWARC